MHPHRHLIYDHHHFHDLHDLHVLHDLHDFHDLHNFHDIDAQYQGELEEICRYVQLIREGGQAVSCKESLRRGNLRNPRKFR